MFDVFFRPGLGITAFACLRSKGTLRDLHSYEVIVANGNEVESNCKGTFRDAF